MQYDPAFLKRSLNESKIKLKKYPCSKLSCFFGNELTWYTQHTNPRMEKI